MHATNPLDNCEIPHPTHPQQTKTRIPPATNTPHQSTHQNQHIQTTNSENEYNNMIPKPTHLARIME